MKFLAHFLRRLLGPSLVTLVADLHVRLLNDWILESDGSFIHPRCVWKLANGHPCEGVYEGRDFYDRYIREIDSAYPDWHIIVNEIIGSPIGGTVVGEYQFRHEVSGLWYTAPFTHFYRIHQEQIVGVRYYMGEVSIHLHQSQELTDLSALFAFHSLN
ncbi:nuclear transport factor 2 family protein [Spirosoma spitsbergense]|uniref:nuclear transport factor 2 family protein n=1 Tax=Spirosoma spitsbergense TaxID=431554 RepID=UPI00036DB72F|nr:nuclear transport factor 2 family protein [Spirosoma spitsbergense]